MTATIATNFQPKVVDSKSSDEELFFIKSPNIKKIKKVHLFYYKTDLCEKPLHMILRNTE